MCNLCFREVKAYIKGNKGEIITYEDWINHYTIIFNQRHIEDEGKEEREENKGKYMMNVINTTSDLFTPLKSVSLLQKYM